jgi:hypothetical protein
LRAPLGLPDFSEDPPADGITAIRMKKKRFSTGIKKMNTNGKGRPVDLSRLKVMAKPTHIKGMDKLKRVINIWPSCEEGEKTAFEGGIK